MKPRYSFEKVYGEERWQVRLKGLFVTYVDKKDSKLVDEKLRQNGWSSREEFIEEAYQ
jgi:hypothetical protein